MLIFFNSIQRDRENNPSEKTNIKVERIDRSWI